MHKRQVWTRLQAKFWQVLVSSFCSFDLYTFSIFLNHFFQVSVNVNALLSSENIELPSGLVLTATRTAEGGDKDTLALTFEVIYFVSHFTSNISEWI